jgi:hypothetical protein
MKIYKCGLGIYQAYVVANTESEAIRKASDIMGIPYLPVTAEEVTVDGYDVQVVPTGERGGDVIGEEIQGDGGSSEPKQRGQGPGKSARRTSGAGKKSNK